MKNKNIPYRQGLYDPAHEHDSCGVGFVVNINAERSHLIVERGIEVLRKLLHRGATADDHKTGDGAGILLQIPDAFLRTQCQALKINLPAAGQFGVGMIFMPQQEPERKHCQRIVEETTIEEGLDFLGWRVVPVCDSTLGKKAKEEQPFVMQCFIAKQGLERISGALERKLYVLRRQIELKVEAALALQDRFYIPSFSSQTIVYKGLLMGTQLTEFYLDLNAPSFVSALAVIHQRYSTNTFPSWKLAQPFRYLAHNGEINTLRGNLNQMKAREKFLKSDLFKEELKKILPVIDPHGSDSACLDNALELLTSCGRDLPHAMMMLIPQAWGLKYPIGPDLRGFFEYHAGLM
ncbi:MAG TPA: glutamate synthase subunit alpha, partial [Candidatus Omnitrophota bacterium]|nr:glutamate synthase subunit alpha [Candidatus Omnitrophota bacterium]